MKARWCLLTFAICWGNICLALEGLEVRTGISGVDQASVLQRQPFELWVDLFDDGSVERKSAGVLEQAGFYIRFLGADRRKEIHKNGNLVHRYRWLVLPAVAGDVVLTPPVINIDRRRRKPTGSLVPEAISLKVHPIASFLPTWLAVSNLSLSEQSVTAVVKDKVATWTLEIEGIALTKESVEMQIKEQLQSDEVFFFPPSIGIKTNDGNPLISRMTITMGFRTSGFKARLPSLYISSISPQTGALQSLYVKPPQIHVESPWTRLLYTGLKVLGIVLLFVLVILGLLFLSKEVFRRREINRLLGDESLSPCDKYRALKRWLGEADVRVVEAKMACFSKAG